MSEQVRLNHSADDVYQMRKDWAESFHFDAPVDLPGLLDDYDALQAEADALRAENGRLQADRDRANQYANQQALECNKLSTDLEAARGLLESAVVLFVCHCTDATAKNWHDAAAAFLTATPAPMKERCDA